MSLMRHLVKYPRRFVVSGGMALATQTPGSPSHGDSSIGRGSIKDHQPDTKVCPWMERFLATVDHVKSERGYNYVQLATVGAGNMPTCRTVVYRGLSTFDLGDEGGQVDAFKIITDSRSEKIDHLLQSNNAEVVWWVPQTKEQYRLSGSFVIIGAPDSVLTTIISSNVNYETAQLQRKEMWRNLSPVAREQFYWPSPGAEYSSDVTAKAKESLDRNASDHIPANFLLLIFIPKTVKYLRLTDNFAQVDRLLSTNNRIGSANIMPQERKNENNANATGRSDNLCQSYKWTSTRVNP